MTGGSTGGSDYRANISDCNGIAIPIGTMLESENGNMIGPTAQGVSALIALDPSAQWDPVTKSVINSCAQRRLRRARPAARAIVAVPIFDTALLRKHEASGASAVQDRQHSRLLPRSDAGKRCSRVLDGSAGSTTGAVAAINPQASFLTRFSSFGRGDFVIQVAVLSNDLQLEEALRSAGLKVGTRRPRHSVGRGRAGDPLRPRSWSTSAASASCRQVWHRSASRTAARASCSIASSLDPHMMLEAMRAGVTECVQEPITPQSLDQAVRRVLVDAVPEQLGQRVRVHRRQGRGRDDDAGGEHGDVACALRRAATCCWSIFTSGREMPRCLSASSRASRLSTCSKTSTAWTMRSSAASSKRPRSASISWDRRIG